MAEITGQEIGRVEKRKELRTIGLKKGKKKNKKEPTIKIQC